MLDTTSTAPAVINQHLIDPEICIRCNTCEATCPVGAITHDSNNYVVDANICNLCMACVPPCPTGSIDNWRAMPLIRAYSIEEQLSWEALPSPLPQSQLPIAANADRGNANAISETQLGSAQAPWSAAQPLTNVYGPKASDAFITATVTGNVRVTDVGHDYDTHHIVLDFGSTPFALLEGQSIGIIAPGVDANGKAHHARQYSIASARDGERSGYNNASLTVKRVLEDHQGQPVRGVASNYLCDLNIGDQVKAIGPFGSSFLMPNHPGSHIVMICTGTGSAPMRAMTERRRRLKHSGSFEGGQLFLFFGARSQQELPYFGPLQSLPKEFIDINLAFSRTPNQPKRYVQDAMRERTADLASLLTDANAYFYVCGLKAMEQGVMAALKDIATQSGLDWSTIELSLKKDARLHLETY
jgi:benzoyl-CoA 2,3-epoxidase subunit A